MNETTMMDFVGRAVAVRDDRAVERNGGGGWAALADANVHDVLGQLLPRAIEMRAAQRHIAGAFVVGARPGFHRAAVEPDQPEARAGVEERREAVLHLRTVMMRRKRRRPCPAIVCRPCEPQIVAGRGRAVHLHPVGD